MIFEENRIFLDFQRCHLLVAFRNMSLDHTQHQTIIPKKIGKQNYCSIFWTPEFTQMGSFLITLVCWLFLVSLWSISFFCNIPEVTKGRV